MTSGPHPREQERLAALRSYNILDTPREADYDDVVKLLTEICDVPISAISLIDDDRQFFKAQVGLGDATGTGRDISICTHSILQRGLFIVPDTTQDPRFAANPLVAGDPNLRFYAGAVLEDEDGLPIGTVCVLDYKPRVLDDRQQRILKLMARQVMTQIALRREVVQRRAAEKQQELLIAELHHRVKNTLATVQAVIQLSLRASPDMASFSAGINQRIASLAHTHTLLSERRWDAVSFRDLVATELEPYQRAGRLTFAGPDFGIDAQSAVTMGMVIHELTTNASKYGALSREAGRLAVTWTLGDAAGDQMVDLHWQETGGPPVTPPKREGFGSSLLRRILERQFHGKAEFSFRPEGLAVHAQARLPRFAA